MLIETDSHLDYRDLPADLDELLRRAPDAVSAHRLDDSPLTEW